MGGMSWIHWLMVLFIGLGTLIPAAHALKRVGLHPAWSILSIIPFVGWFAIWAFAFAPWPKVDGKGPASEV